MRSYLDLSRRLEDELRTAAAGDPVPSENDLARRFRVSRFTARAVLQELERRHVVRRIQGRGTFVAERLEYRITEDGPTSFTEILRAAGKDPHTTTDHWEHRRASGREQQALALGRGAKVIELHRRRWLEGRLAGLGSSVLPVALVPHLEDHLANDGSLNSVLVDVYDLEPQRAWFRGELLPAPEEVAELLELRGRPEVLHSQGRLESRRLGRPIEIFDDWLRIDLFTLVVELGTPR